MSRPTFCLYLCCFLSYSTSIRTVGCCFFSLAHTKIESNRQEYSNNLLLVEANKSKSSWMYVYMYIYLEADSLWTNLFTDQKLNPFKRTEIIFQFQDITYDIYVKNAHASRTEQLQFMKINTKIQLCVCVVIVFRSEKKNNLEMKLNVPMSCCLNRCIQAKWGCVTQHTHTQ